MKQPIQKPQLTKTREQFLKDLEERLRRNKGSFTTFAEATSNVPWREAGRRGQEPFAQKSEMIAKAAEPEPFAVQEQVEEPIDEGPTGSIEEFLDNLYESTGTTDSIISTGQATSDDGGVITNKNETLYQDGSLKTVTGEVLQAVQVLPGGGLVYENGETRYFDTQTAGVLGLSTMLFGEEVGVTQQYGNYNPSLYGSGSHQGTDLAVLNRAFSLPVNAKIVGMFFDDGSKTRNAPHQGYGNSLFIELPSGERVRLSHLSHMGQFEIGQEVPAGTYLGTTGNTGYSTGPHLDLEYYNPAGQRGDPNQFNAQVLAPYIVKPQEPGQEGKPQEYAQNYSGQPYTPSQIQPKQQLTGFSQAPQSNLNILGQGVNELGQKIGLPKEGFVGAGELAGGDVQGARNELASSINKWNPTGKAGFGFTETLQNNPEAAKQERLNTAMDQMNKPLTNPFANLIKSVRQAAGNTVEAIGDAIPVINEGNWSELIAGGPTKKSAAFASEQPTGAIASGPNQNYTPNIQEQYQPGKGVSKLFSGTAGLFSRPSTTEISPKLALGNVAPGGQDLTMASYQPKGEAKPNDTRDLFFKSGLAEQYKDKMVPGAEQVAGGALTTDLFTPSFYENINNISQVFGDTANVPSQTKQQAIELFKNQFRSRYSGEDYDPKEVESILSQINDLPQNMSLNVPQPQKKMATLESYLAKGRPASQWYAETGQQSALDTMRAIPGFSMEEKTGQIRTPQYVGGFSPETRSYSQNARAGGISYGPNQNYTPSFANMTSRFTGQPAYNPPPKISQPSQPQGLFKRIKNWFQR